MKSWRQMDVDLGARIESEFPEFVVTGYCESLDDQRMKTCRTPACYRMWQFPETDGELRAGRIIPGRRQQILPVRMILGLIFDSRRSLASEETAHGEAGSLDLVPRVIQSVVTWWPNPHFRDAFELCSATTNREEKGTRTYWDVEFRTSIDEPFA